MTILADHLQVVGNPQLELQTLTDLEWNRRENTELTRVSINNKKLLKFSWAEHCDDRLVNPTMSANSILKTEEL